MSLQGKQSNFVAGIWFPHDGIIDSTSFSQSLMREAVRKGVVLEESSPHLTDIHVSPTNELTHLILADGSVRRCKKVLVATGTKKVYFTMKTNLIYLFLRGYVYGSKPWWYSSSLLLLPRSLGT
jgi:glycine/D-amino acid oxidase-like deaminating enzyme